MAHDSDMTHGDAHHGVGHIVPIKTLVVTGLALLVLTIITVVAASFDFGAANVFVALAIAAFKASLVVLFFMHLKYDRPFHSFIMVGSVFFVMLFIAFALTDTVEYREDVVGGNAPAVQEKLTELTAQSP
jgi:cytochrome c oxidase subunit 4